MRIVKLKVNDFKRITVVEINPDPNVVEIAGKNAQGKTSIMDAIAALLGGKKLIPEQPVHGDAERSVLEADLGDYIVRRTITPDRKGTISVTNKEGMKAASPQEVLEKLLGDLTFDPLLFVRQKPEEQLNMLRTFAGDVDFAAFDTEEKDAYDERTLVNREIKRLEAVVASAPPADEDGEEQDVSGLLDKLDKMRTRNSKIREMQGKRAAAQMQIDAHAAKIKDSELEIEALEVRLAAEHKRIVEEREKMEPIAEALKNAAPLPQPQDERALTEEIREATEHNNSIAASVGARAKAKADEERLEEETKKSTALTAQIAKVQKAREDALKAIDLPVKGLSMGTTGITFNGHPLSQASFAQQLQLGIALAMKANPKLKIAIVKEASMLDDDAIAMLKKMAVKEDFQVWIERVGSGSEEAFVIEAGEVKATPAKKKAK